MTDIAIRVDNLSKRYRIGQREPYKTLRDAVTNFFRGPFQRRPSRSEFIWALKDVSFEVKRGEVVGIIGRNGAGKTTLLKVLSRITKPTRGYGEVHGRVGSLLEVGTGFHPELTGRENIYLNGAILGMKRAEIDKKFDEIVNFAEIEKFIDTPVKRYSSGMFVRLAFAVAAHLEPEILLVDEVLAVGDAAFQKKCLGKMGDVAKEGRTVLFVSHNVGAVATLCSRGILLEGGKIKSVGPVKEVVDCYLMAAIDSKPEANFPEEPFRDAQFLQVRILNPRGICEKLHNYSDPVTIDMIILVRENLAAPSVYITLCDSSGSQILFAEQRLQALSRKGRHVFRAQIPERLLAPGRFFVSLGISPYPGATLCHYPQTFCSFQVENLASKRTYWPAPIYPPLKWELTTES